MNSRSRWACGASVASSSGVPHTGHITSSSTSPSVVLGQSAASAAGATPSSASVAASATAARLTTLSSSSGATVARMNSSFTGPRRTAATRPRASITKVSG